MTSYDITGTLLLSFIFEGEQQDVLIDSGHVETDGCTVWYLDDKGLRFESITTSNVIDVGLVLGVLCLRGDS